MEPAETIQHIAKRPKAQRSRVANGSKLLPLTDCRSASARRFKDLIEDICLDLGGRDLLSEAQKQLVRRASLLSAECERMEALAARDKRRSDGEIAWKSDDPFVFDIDTYVVMTNALRRVVETLGLRRIPRPVNDGSTVLVDYFDKPLRPVPE